MNDDAVGKIFSAIFLTFCMFFLPLLLVFNNADLTQRSYVDEAVQVFTEEARSTGYISYASYQDLMNTITSGGHVFNIKMLHKSKMIIPEGGGQYKTSYVSYNQDDILESIYEGNDYIMKDGDYFTMSVTSQDGMIGSRYFSLLTGSGRDIKIVCTAGGMVGNTKR